MSEQNEMYIIEEEDLGKPMGFFERFISIFIAPGKLAENIAAFPKSGAPSIYILILSLLAAVMSVQITPIITNSQSIIIAERYGVDFLNTEATNQVIANNTLLVVASGYAGVVISMFLSAFFAALGLIILTKIFRGNAKFRQYFSLSLHTAAISLVGGFISAGLILLTGNYMTFTSLAPIFMPTGNFTMPLYNLLSAIELFSIWSTVVAIIGVKKMNDDFSTGKAVAIGIILLVFTVLVTTALASSNTLIYDWTYNQMQTLH